MLLAKWLPILTEDGESGACAAVLLVQVTHQRLLKKLAGEGRALFKSHNSAVSHSQSRLFPQKKHPHQYFPFFGRHV